jgi:hypothetical protein
MSLTKTEDTVSVAIEGVSETITPIRKRGRPRKSEVEAKKNRNSVGRPPGEAARIREFHARLLATTGDKVIETVIRKAMDDTDKDQVACLKMCMDRLLPTSYFEKDKMGGRNAINITISGLGTEPAVIDNNNITDVEDYEHE